jgi:hypothetical protein
LFNRWRRIFSSDGKQFSGNRICEGETHEFATT